MSLAHAATALPAFYPHITGATKALVAAAGLDLHRSARVADEPALAGWESEDGMISVHACGDDLYVDIDWDHEPLVMAGLLELLDDAGYVPASDDPNDDELLDDGIRTYFCLATELVAA